MTFLTYTTETFVANHVTIVARTTTRSTRAPTSENREWTVPAATSRAGALCARHAAAVQYNAGSRSCRDDHIPTADSASRK